MCIVLHMGTELVTTAWAAKALGVHPATVSRMVRDGVIKPAGKAPGTRGAFLFDQADVIRLASKRASETAKAKAS